MLNRRRDFARNVFDHAKMKKYLPQKTYTAILNAEQGKEISWQDTEIYAKATLRWAKSLDATCYSHRFDPFGCSTAGKINQWLCTDLHGNLSEQFGAQQLLQDECDASAFNKMKTPFDAKGEIKLFAPLPPYVKGNCLCIPSVLTCAEGSLDEKSSLFNSCQSVNAGATRLLNALKIPCKQVLSVVGAEQEYFLLDKEKYLQRSDLVETGKILTSRCDAVCKQTDYCRAPSKVISNFLCEVENRLYNFGIIAKTQHKEVAPCQFELAPCCAPTIIAYWQSRLITEILAEVADDFGLVCLFHEKPFPNLNGSGKHNNWSLFADGKENLFERGNTPLQNARYAAFLACVVQAVDLHQDLLCAAAASAGNDCRLGQCEAPPRVISVALGNARTDLHNAAKIGQFDFGKDLLPTSERYVRNRTSPLAFTQNKLEFRLVGASDSLAKCNTVLNAIVAESCQKLAHRLENSNDVWKEAQQFVGEVLTQNGKILFDGDNYCANWQALAAHRKLFFAANAPQALEHLECTQLFQQQNVASPIELQALKNASLENYCEQLEKQAKVLSELCLRKVLPILRKILLQNVDLEQQTMASFNANYRKKVDTCAKKLYIHAKAIAKCTQKAPASVAERARFFAETLVALMASTQKWISVAQSLCPDKLWPLTEESALLRYD